MNAVFMQQTLSWSRGTIKRMKSFPKGKRFGVAFSFRRVRGSKLQASAARLKSKRRMSLVVRGENSREERDAHVRQRVMLRLPRRIELSASSISGSLNIGDVADNVRVNSISGGTRIGNVAGDLCASSISGSMTIGEVAGAVRLGSISGGVRVGQAIGSFEASSVSGSVTATITRLDERGVHINSVSGGVNLRFTNELNADVATTHISGHVSLDMPNVSVQSNAESSSLRARIGAGGARISISSVSGGVRLTR
jgi:hypothetical protein